MSKDSTSKPQCIPSKILPPQISRLNKEEEQESWISGEELCTDGSSEEENYGCKSASLKTNKNSTSQKCYQSKIKLDERARKKHLQTAPSEDENSASQSTSEVLKSVNSRSEEEECMADDEISWKVNREKSSLKSEIISLEDQEEFSKTCETMDKIFEDYSQFLNHLEEIEDKNFTRQSEKFEDEIKSNIRFLDTTIHSLDSNLERIRIKTKEIQQQNRSRLREIILESPSESKMLADNTKHFFELYVPDKMITR